MQASTKKSAYGRIIQAFSQTLAEVTAKSQRYTHLVHHYHVYDPLSRFPRSDPFPSQLQVMQVINDAIVSWKHALIESPTGTGKTLALICGVLAWQESEYKRRCQNEDIEDNGGEILPPLVVYATRTLQQARGVVRELRETSYRVRMGSIAARMHCCLLRPAGTAERCSVDSKCEALRAALELREDKGCPHLKAMENRDVIAETIEELMADGSWDIEDCVRVCSAEHIPVERRPCPYYLSKELTKRADFIVTPYSYILNPGQSILSQMGHRVGGSVFIFDEAHNIEDNCREETSWECAVTDLLTCFQFLHRVSSDDEILRPFESPDFQHDLVVDLPEDCRCLLFVLSHLSTYLRAVEQKAEELRRTFRVRPADGTEVPILCFGLDENRPTKRFIRAIALDENCLEKLTLFTTSVNTTVPALRRLGTFLPAESASTRECFLSRLDAVSRRLSDMSVFFALLVDNPSKYLATIADTWEELKPPSLKLKLTCLWAGVAMEPISSAVRTVVLASGTLAPFGALLAELGPSMEERCARAVSLDHVVSPRQLKIHLLNFLPMTVKGLTDVSYAHLITLGSANELEILSERVRFTAEAYTENLFWRLGLFLLLIATNMEGGVLLFFSKYVLIDQAIATWKTLAWNNPSKTAEDMSMWDALQERFGEISVDSKQPSVFAAAMGRYRDGVARCRRALFLSVYRSKLSEGMSLNDALARVVICLGVPYASLEEIGVRGKRAYNDRTRRDTERRRPKHSAVPTPSTEDSPAPAVIAWGQSWYEQNAYRAIFQAAGRSVRHSRDYGMVFLIDDRHNLAKLQKYAPRWTLPYVSPAGKPLTVIFEEMHDFFFRTPKSFSHFVT